MDDVATLPTTSNRLVVRMDWTEISTTLTSFYTNEQWYRSALSTVSDYSFTFALAVLFVMAASPLVKKALSGKSHSVEATSKDQMSTFISTGIVFGSYAFSLASFDLFVYFIGKGKFSADIYLSYMLSDALTFAFILGVHAAFRLYLSFSSAYLSRMLIADAGLQLYGYFIFVELNHADTQEIYAQFGMIYVVGINFITWATFIALLKPQLTQRIINNHLKPFYWTVRQTLSGKKPSTCESGE